MKPIGMTCLALAVLFGLTGAAQAADGCCWKSPARGYPQMIPPRPMGSEMGGNRYWGNCPGSDRPMMYGMYGQSQGMEGTEQGEEMEEQSPGQQMPREGTPAPGTMAPPSKRWMERRPMAPGRCPCCGCGMGMMGPGSRGHMMMGRGYGRMGRGRGGSGMMGPRGRGWGGPGMGMMGPGQGRGCGAMGPCGQRGWEGRGSGRMGYGPGMDWSRRGSSHRTWGGRAWSHGQRPTRDWKHYWNTKQEENQRMHAELDPVAAAFGGPLHADGQPAMGEKECREAMSHYFEDHGYLGLQTDWPRGLAEPVVVGVAPGSPAEKAGIQKDDLLESANGVPFLHRACYELAEMTGHGFKPNDTVTISVKRGTQITPLDATLAELEGPQLDQMIDSRCAAAPAEKQEEHQE